MAAAPEAKAVLGADSRKLNKDLKSARRMFDREMTGMGRSAKKLLGGVFSPQFLGVGVGAAGLQSLFTETLSLEEGLTRLGIQGGKTVAEMNAFREQMLRVSEETGLAAQEILDGARAYVSLTGDIEGAEKSMDLFAKVATASGATMEDITRTAASLRQNLKIDPKDFEKAFSTLLAQGKQNAIELKDTATILSGVAPLFSKFGITGTEGLTEMGAALQLVRQGFGSAEEAAVGFRGMMVAFLRNEKRFRKLGIQIFEKRGGRRRLRRLSLIVEELARKGLSEDKLIEAFGRVEGARAFIELAKVPGKMEEIAAATRDVNDVMEDQAKFLDSNAGQIRKAFNKLKVRIAESLTPERIEKLASAITKLVDLLIMAGEHAREIAVAFVAIKGVQLAASFVRMAAAAKAMEASFTATLTRATAIAGALATAGAAGFALGKFLDETFGLSEKISDRAISTKEPEIQTGFIRDRAREALAGELTNRGAKALLSQAEEFGFTSKRESRQARLAEISEKARRFGLGFSDADQLARAIEIASRQLKGENVTVDVNIRTDNLGQVSAEWSIVQGIRRGSEQ